MKALVVLGLLCASTHWILARSVITKPIWSRASGRLDELLRCAGCSGWWLGIVWGALGVRPVFEDSIRLLAVLAAGVLGAILTPIFEAVLLWGLEQTAIGEPEPDETAEPPAV